MKFTAVGDILIQRRISADYKGYDTLKPFIERGDARFFNLETTLNEEGECFASQFSGGTYIRTSKKVLEDIKKFGFNMTSFNNNHVLDFSYDGLYKTLEAVNESGLVHSGVGMNLAQASAPGFLETKNGRVGLISVNTSFDSSMMAGEQSERVKGRPGINGLRIEEKFEVSGEELEFIKALAKKTGVNNEKESEIRQGYALPEPEGQASFGKLKFVKSDRTARILEINKADLERVKKSIENAVWQADEVVVSIHTHQMEGSTQENVTEFTKNFAHFCIDCGAAAVIGHGPHLLRGIEVYRDCPVFYSLGDFVLELYNVELAPEDFFTKYGLRSNSGMYELLKTRSRDFTVGLMESEVMNETVIPYWETENGKLKYLELLPVKVDMSGKQSDRGLPFVAEDDSFMKRLAELSKPLGTEIVKENGVYICRW